MIAAAVSVAAAGGPGPVAAPRREPLTPFLPWSPDARAPISEDAIAEASGRSLAVDLLRDPEAVVARLLDPAELQALVLGAVTLIGAAMAVFAAAVMAGRGLGSPLRAGALASCNTLLALAAVLPPIHALGVLLAARLPLGRLVATLLAATATGALVLGAMAPLAYMAWKLDPYGNGVAPYALVLSYALAAVASAGRLRRLLLDMAAEVARRAASCPDAVLAAEDAHRVGIFVRLATVLLAFTSALSLWGFDAFL